ncbi:AbrB/MazE/SpoVT family DNA-binding domain-containing protein [Candidatus Microgenomates bacterium]|nr:AbrB/MazE/SpoVT family DNA-binding domain-containing protein [Candidatus Microgenomates bacterium]
MTYLATITSKRQFTIPVEVFKLAKLKANQKVLVSLEDSKLGAFKVQSMRQLVEDMAGSVPVAKEYKGLSLNHMVEKSRNDYYKNEK